MFRLNLKEIGLLAGPAAAADSIITLDGTTVTSTVRLVEALTLDNAVLLRNIDSDHAKTERLQDTDIGKEKTDKIITLRLTSNSMRSGEKKNFSLQAKKNYIDSERCLASDTCIEGMEESTRFCLLYRAEFFQLIEMRRHKRRHNQLGKT